jgi:hypothetical protein
MPRLPGACPENLLQADEDRERLRRQILDEKVSFESMREQLFFIARENQKQTRVFIMNILQGLMKPLWTEVMQRLEAEMKTWGEPVAAHAPLRAVGGRHDDRGDAPCLEEEHRHFYGTLKKAHAGLPGPWRPSG